MGQLIIKKGGSSTAKPSTPYQPTDMIDNDGRFTSRSKKYGPTANGKLGQTIEFVATIDYSYLKFLLENVDLNTTDKQCIELHMSYAGHRGGV